MLFLNYYENVDLIEYLHSNITFLLGLNMKI